MTPPLPDSVAAQNIVATLRALSESRALTWPEERSIAERQAALLLALSGIDEPPVPLFVITALPGIQIDWRAGWPLSGMAVQTRPHHWRIVIASHEPLRRKRFSVAHEFKHVLDDPFIDRVHPHLKAEQHERRSERLCNYFAACLLMPRGWLKADWAAGIQNLRELAKRYYVSDVAMRTRLQELGLLTEQEASR